MVSLSTRNAVPATEPASARSLGENGGPRRGAWHQPAGCTTTIKVCHSHSLACIRAYCTISLPRACISSRAGSRQQQQQSWQSNSRGVGATAVRHTISISAPASHCQSQHSSTQRTPHSCAVSPQSHTKLLCCAPQQARGAGRMCTCPPAMTAASASPCGCTCTACSGTPWTTSHKR